MRSLISTGKFVFAGTSTGIYRSPDNGDNWEPVNGLEATCFAFLDSNLFAGTSGSGVFLSKDEGGSWEQINNGLMNLKINDFAANAAYLFSGSGGGVFRTQKNF